MYHNVTISVKVEGLDQYLAIYHLGHTIGDVRELILQSSGWDIQECASNGALLPWLEKIKHGLHELESNPKKYKQYESKEGRCSIGGVWRFYRYCLDSAECWFNLHDGERWLPAVVVWVS